jgi:hypothetical protein
MCYLLMPFERQIEKLGKDLEYIFFSIDLLKKGQMLLLKVWADQFEILLQQCELLINL